MEEEELLKKYQNDDTVQTILKVFESRQISRNVFEYISDIDCVLNPNWSNSDKYNTEINFYIRYLGNESTGVSNNLIGVYKRVQEEDKPCWELKYQIDTYFQTINNIPFYFIKKCNKTT